MALKSGHSSCQHAPDATPPAMHREMCAKEHNSESITTWTLLKFLRITRTDREDKQPRLER